MTEARLCKLFRTSARFTVLGDTWRVDLSLYINGLADSVDSLFDLITKCRSSRLDNNLLRPGLGRSPTPSQFLCFSFSFAIHPRGILYFLANEFCD